MDAQLSYTYTNHSIRSTCITILDQADVEAHHIMAVSGRTSESSLRTYTKASSKKQKHILSLLSDNASSLVAKKCRIARRIVASVISLSPEKLLPVNNSLSRDNTVDTDLEKNMFEKLFRQFA